MEALLHQCNRSSPCVIKYEYLAALKTTAQLKHSTLITKCSGFGFSTQPTNKSRGSHAQLVTEVQLKQSGTTPTVGSVIGAELPMPPGEAGISCQLAKGQQATKTGLDPKLARCNKLDAVAKARAVGLNCAATSNVCLVFLPRLRDKSWCLGSPSAVNLESFKVSIQPCRLGN